MRQVCAPSVKGISRLVAHRPKSRQADKVRVPRKLEKGVEEDQTQRDSRLQTDQHLHGSGSVIFLSRMINLSRYFGYVCSLFLCRLRQDVVSMLQLLQRLLTVNLNLNAENAENSSYVPRLLTTPPEPITTQPSTSEGQMSISLEQQKRNLVETAQKMSTLQAFAVDPANHRHLVQCYSTFVDKNNLHTSGLLLGEVTMRKACTLLNLDIISACSLVQFMKDKMHSTRRSQWAKVMITALYEWQCENQFEDDPLKVFEDDSYNHEGNPFDLQPPLPQSDLSRWYARLPPTIRITKLGEQVSYTLANGVQPELAVNKEFHIAMPTTFKPEHPTLNLHISAEDQTTNLQWKLDSCEFTDDLVTAIELKNTIVCSLIFGQVGIRGRYTCSIEATHPNLTQCRVGVLLNVPLGFADSLKHARLVQEAALQHVHLLYWQPKSKSDVDGYVATIKGWQTSCRQQVPFAQHKTCVPL